MEDMAAYKRALGELTLGEIAGRLVGPPKSETIGAFGRGLNKMTMGQMPKTVGRFAGSALGRGVLRAAPALGVASAAIGAGDIVLGGDSMANKAMDTLGMGIGGTAGFLLGGPLGAAAGAGIGKTISDGTQFLLGGSKSAEQRKMEEALMMLRGGQV